MAESSLIEWTDATWNPVTGCSVISPGCTNCYAMRLAGTRLKHHASRQGLTVDTKAGPVWNGEVRLNEGWLDQPLRWRRPRRIFVCAHGDLFHPSVPFEWVDRVFATMWLTQQHTYQVLTKRGDRMAEYLATPDRVGRILEACEQIEPTASLSLRMRNVWLGVSVEDQTRADERRSSLAALAAEGWTTFVSYEPALGLVDWAGWEFLRWMICGGENGERPMHPDWARSARDFCLSAKIPFFFKQWGSWSVVYDRDQDDPDWRRCPTEYHHGERYLNLEGGTGFHGDRVVFARRVGKKAAGRLLDGAEHNGMPDGNSKTVPGIETP